MTNSHYLPFLSVVISETRPQRLNRVRAWVEVWVSEEGVLLTRTNFTGFYYGPRLPPVTTG